MGNSTMKPGSNRQRFGKDVNEFPTFAKWVLQIFKLLVASLFLILVFYPAFSLLLNWLGWQDLFPRIARKARMGNHPMIIGWTLYVALGCVAAYPFLAIGHRLSRRLFPRKHSKKKNRII